MSEFIDFANEDSRKLEAIIVGNRSKKTDNHEVVVEDFFGLQDEKEKYKYSYSLWGQVTSGYKRYPRTAFQINRSVIGENLFIYRLSIEKRCMYGRYYDDSMLYYDYIATPTDLGEKFEYIEASKQNISEEIMAKVKARPEDRINYLYDALFCDLPRIHVTLFSDLNVILYCADGEQIARDDWDNLSGDDVLRKSKNTGAKQKLMRLRDKIIKT